MKFLHLIWGNLTRKKLRTTLTLLSVLVAFVLFGFLAAIKQALVGGVEMAGVDRLVVRHKVSLIQLLPESYKARMERLPGVALATHQTWFGGIYQDPKNFFMQNPVLPEEFLAMHPEWILAPDQLKAWLQTRTGAIVGRNTANRFHWKIGDKVPIRSPIWDNRVWEFDLVGIFDGRDKRTDTTSMFFRYDYFEEARPRGKGLVGWYTIRVKNPAEAAEVAKRVDAEFENSPAETKTEPEGAFTQAFAKQIGNIAFIAATIMGAVFFTILLVTGNTMSQAVRERTGELGVLKAIGFTNRQVVSLVLAESCLLTVLGGGLGLGLAWMIISRGDPTGGMLPLFLFPPRDLVIDLQKRIPSQAGLGGGSADAAATLVALNQLWKLGLNPTTLARIGGRLGADVPFFLVGGTALGLGRGDDIYPLDEMPPVHVVVLRPAFGVSTVDAYGWYDKQVQRHRREPPARPAPPGWPSWSASLRNDLEPPVTKHHPAIGRLRQSLVDAGATFAAMSGSGSAVFGLFERADAARRTANDLARPGWAVVCTKTLNRREYARRLAVLRSRGDG